MYFIFLSICWVIYADTALAYTASDTKNQFRLNVRNWRQNIVKSVRYPTRMPRQGKKKGKEKQAFLCSNAKCKCSNSLQWESTQLHSNEQTIKIHRSPFQTKERNPMTDLAERVGRKGNIYKKTKPPFWYTRSNLLKPDFTSPTVLFSIARPSEVNLLHLVKAATTAHSSSLVLLFMLSPSGSRSSSCRTLFMARSYWSSSSGAKAFSSTSEEWARNIRARIRLSIRWGSFTHLSSTASCTFLIRRCLILLLVRGCVVMSNNRKFCFSVVRTPFSTRFLARRSRTLRSW